MSKENALFPVVKGAIAFDSLWQQAKEMITALSGDVWTDTAEHDPGVTLLQSATWNCADLSYRASLSLNDLLTQKDQNTLFPTEFGPENVLTCTAITAEDYRRALLDLHSRDIPLDTSSGDFLFSDASLVKEPEALRFHWWYNAEKREYSFRQPAEARDATRLTLRGNVYLSLIPSRFTQSLSPENLAKVNDFLNTFLTEHRNLGEQISRIIWLKPVVFTPRMSLELVDNSVDVNRLVAEIYQTTDAFLRPRVRRYTTEQRRALGDQDDVIFEGPKLRYGWQETEPTVISSAGYPLDLSPLVNQLLAIPGIASLNSLTVDPVSAQLTAVKGDSWRWQIAEGYYPQLWGAAPLDTLTNKDSPLTLVAKDGVISPLDRQIIARYLIEEAPGETTFPTLPAGRFRDQTPYVPVGQRLPECYAMQQPDALIDAPTRALHQFLLPVDQLLADGTAELALLPRLLAFKQRGEAIRGTRWPYHDALHQSVHRAYSSSLKGFGQRNVAIFPDQGNTPDRDNFARELDFLQYLLGYFGTQRAALPLAQDLTDFLATQRASLAQQPTLGYDRINLRIDRVSALQKRIAARIGLGSICFADKPDLAQLPFYLIEHRQLLPKIPDATFNNEHTPTAFAVDAALVALTQPGTTGKVARGQLIDLVMIEGKNRIYVRRLLIIATNGDTLVFSTDNSQQLLNNLDRLLSAWEGGNLRWCNSNVWLQDMTYRLNYAASALQPSDKRQRLLASSLQSPYPAMVAVNDVIVLRPAALKLAMSGSGDKQSKAEDTEWQLKATVKAIDPLAGTLLIERTPDSTATFPTEENSYLYQWAFSDPAYATTDRFSFVLSAVLNRRLLTNQNSVPDKLAAWIQEAIMAELPAHLSLITHWLDEPAFRNFGTTYQRWQNNGTPLGDDAFAILHMLSLGRLPVNQLDIGLMRIATEAQRTAAIGGDGSRWDSNVILENQLFYVPQNIPVTP